MTVPLGTFIAPDRAAPAPSARSGQSRGRSAVEAVTGVAVGYGVAVLLSWWLLGITPQRAAGVSVWFTVASLVRSYALRRLFARWG